MSEIDVLRSTLMAARSANLAALHALDSALLMINGDSPASEVAKPTEPSSPVVMESEALDSQCQHHESVEVRGKGVKVCADCGENLPIV